MFAKGQGWGLLTERFLVWSGFVKKWEMPQNSPLAQFHFTISCQYDVIREMTIQLLSSTAMHCSSYGPKGLRPELTCHFAAPRGEIQICNPHKPARAAKAVNQALQGRVWILFSNVGQPKLAACINIMRPSAHFSLSTKTRCCKFVHYI